MAATDKNILISPQRGSTTNVPSIVLTGDGNDPLTISVLDGTPGSLSVEASSGQLFSITNNLTAGSIFSVNDVSGIPSLNIDANGTVSMASFGSGRLLVGTSTAENNFNQTITSGLTPYMQIKSAERLGLSVQRTNGPGAIVLASSVTAANGNSIGNLVYSNTDGTNFLNAASITAAIDGTPGADDMPGRLVFSTTADGASSPTERMRINNTGTLLAGTTSLVDLATNAFGFNYVPGNFLCVATTVGGNACAIFNKTNSNAGLVVAIRYNGTNVGSITNTSTTTAYNTSSDYRLKENVVPLTGAVDRLNQLQVRRFNFLADPDTVVDGFLAHEAQEVVPECVTGTKDEVDADGNPVYQGIDQSKLVPLLTAALQEALAKIENLEGRLTAAGI